MENKHSQLLVFSKAPVAGKVKTRLIPALGAEGAAQLHQELLTICLDKVTAAKNVDVALWCSPDTDHPYFAAQPLPRYPQQGGDLGEKMAYALEQALTVCDQAVLLGTDSPALSLSTLMLGLDSLRSGYDAVIVPAEDGGYVAIGMRHVDRAVFEGVNWGSDQVYAQTVERFEQLGWRWKALEMCWDIDRPNDLERYKNWKIDDRK
jgi:rSAM/selenodomain-associated transferase 1